jgi:elongin-C
VCSSSVSEADTGEINFREISSPVLQRVIEYCYHKKKYMSADSQVSVPEFPIAPEMALELLMAANFLDV